MGYFYNFLSPASRGSAGGQRHPPTYTDTPPPTPASPSRRRQRELRPHGWRLGAGPPPDGADRAWGGTAVRGGGGGVVVFHSL